MSDCIFCKIISGDIPAYKVYEDDNVLAFLDIAPVNPGHTLVIPKKHHANLEEIPEVDLCLIIKVVKKIGLKLKEGLGSASYNVIENNDKVAGQIIPHIHFHVIPRNEGDGLGLWPQKSYEEGKVEEVLNKIKID